MLLIILKTQVDKIEIPHFHLLEEPRKHEEDQVKVSTEVGDMLARPRCKMLEDQGFKMITRDAVCSKKGLKENHHNSKVQEKFIRKNILLTNRFSTLKEDEGQCTLRIHTEEACKMFMIGNRMPLIENRISLLENRISPLIPRF